MLKIGSFTCLFCLPGVTGEQREHHHHQDFLVVVEVLVIEAEALKEVEGVEEEVEEVVCQ